MAESANDPPSERSEAASPAPPAELEPPEGSRGGQALFLIGFVILAAELWLGRGVSIVIGADGSGLALALGAFLFGSAAGSLVAGRGTSSPARWSIAAVILFALSAIAIALLPTLVSGVGGGTTLVRGLGALLVALPAFAFGGLPVAWFGVGSLDEKMTIARVGHWVGALDLGSAIGAIALPLLLLPLLGSTLTALALTVLLAIAIVPTLARRALKAESPASSRAETGSESSTPGHTRTVRIAIAAWVGAGTLALQLISTRLLGELVGTSLVVFGVATAATLGGGALAAWVIPRCLARWGAMATIRGAALLWLIAQGALAWTLAELPHLLLWSLGTLGEEGGHLSTPLKLCLVAIVVAPVSLASGLVLPALLAGWGHDPRGLRKEAGRVDAAWMLGGALGAWGIGLAILPTFGSGSALATVAAGTLLFCVLGGGWGRRESGERAALPRPLFGGGVILAAALFGGAHLRWDPALLGAGVYHWNRGDVATGAALAGWRAREVTYVGEGALAKVSIEVAPLQNTSYLRVGGRIEGSVPIDPHAPSFADLPTEIMLGILPVIEGAGEGDLLTIGLGGGTTVTTAAEVWDGPVVALEVEPEVARALRSPAGKRAFPREHAILFEPGPRTPTLIFEDARAYLVRESRRWDAVICQPSEPWLPWSAPLFTPEFYELVRLRLAPGGVAVHWLQLYEIGPPEFAAIVQAFLGAFPDARLYHPPRHGRSDLGGGRDAESHPPSPAEYETGDHRGVGTPPRGRVSADPRRSGGAGELGGRGVSGREWRSPITTRVSSAPLGGSRGGSVGGDPAEPPTGGPLRLRRLGGALRLRERGGSFRTPCPIGTSSLDSSGGHP